MNVFEAFWDNLFEPLFKTLWSFYWNPAILALYGGAVIAFFLIMAVMGWYTINTSPEHVVSCAKLSWLLAFASSYAAFIPVMLAANEHSDGTPERLSIIILGYIMMYLPILLLKFVFNKIPLLNLAGPFILYVLTIPYAITLRVHGNLGYDPEKDGYSSGGVHYNTY